jgi:hypothetical protein
LSNNYGDHIETRQHPNRANLEFRDVRRDSAQPIHHANYESNGRARCEYLPLIYNIRRENLDYDREREFVEKEIFRGVSVFTRLFDLAACLNYKLRVDIVPSWSIEVYSINVLGRKSLELQWMKFSR